MSYPQYPQYPQGQQPAVGAPFPQQGYGAMPSAPPGAQQPSSATAIIAAVLAVLGGLWALVGVITWIEATAAFAAIGGFMVVWGVILLILQVAVVGLLLGGAIMIFMKKPVGRWLVAIGCGVVLVMYLFGVIVGFAMVSPLAAQWAGIAAVGVISIIFMIPPIATLVLVMLPSTRKYLEHAAASAKQQQGFGQPAYAAGQQGNYNQPSSGGFNQPPYQG